MYMYMRIWLSPRVSPGSGERGRDCTTTGGVTAGVAAGFSDGDLSGFESVNAGLGTTTGDCAVAGGADVVMGSSSSLVLSSESVSNSDVSLLKRYLSRAAVVDGFCDDSNGHQSDRLLIGCRVMYGMLCY